ncbi:MAG: hypothetical protein U5R46_02185 [Gammaproteobacteria bacterium]|nr:hypothetical protein [Gammaproteobacteria bacterium]
MSKYLLKAAIVVIIALVGGSVVYYIERQVILANAASTFDSRAQLIKQYVTMMKHDVEVMGIRGQYT